MEIQAPNYIPPWDARIIFIVQLFTQIFIYGFTSSNSMLRIAALPIIFGCTYIFMINGSSVLDTASFVGMVAWSVFTPFHYIEVALRSKWDFEHRGPTKTTLYSKFPESGTINGKKFARQGGGLIDRFKFGYSSFVALRDVNQPWHVKDIAAFSSKNPNYIPTRRKFLFHAAATLVVAYLVVDVLESLPPRKDKTPFAKEKIPIFARFSEVSIQEVVTRLNMSTMIWTTSYTSIQLRMSVASFLMVLFGFHQPRDWPAFMGGISNGSLQNIYTLRGFWGDFWHQALRKLFLGNSHFITHNILHFPEGSLATRYTKIFFTFLQSGLVHVPYDWAGGVPFADCGSIRFFSTQVLGIILEDGVQALYRRVTGRKRVDVTPLWARFVGYLWVLVFLLFWSSPAWHFPMVKNEAGDYGATLLPYSLVRGFLKS